MPGKNAFNFDRNIPFLYPIMVESKKMYDRGMAKNWIHKENWIHLPLALHIHEHPYIKRKCYDCGTEITREQVIGCEDFRMTPHCENCIQGPALENAIEAWKVKFKLTRKSQKNPSGIFTLYRVHHPEILFSYIEEIKKTYELMECKVIWTHNPPQLTNPSQSTLPLLGKHVPAIPTEPIRTP